MKGRSPKTDNTSLSLKLELRRKLLAPFAEKHPLEVMDCCAGTRQIWGRLEKEFPIKRYVGFDKKRVGAWQVRVDSVRWLRDVGLCGNVIDVDTYGEPWRHYAAILESAWPFQEILVFLTVGMGLGTLGRVSKFALQAAGLKPDWGDMMPPASAELRKIGAVDRRPRPAFSPAVRINRSLGHG